MSYLLQAHGEVGTVPKPEARRMDGRWIATCLPIDLPLNAMTSLNWECKYRRWKILCDFDRCSWSSLELKA